MSGDNSASARAQRAKLEAELAEANASMEDLYYDRSVRNRQDALDQELEDFRDEKEKEKEGWDKYLEDTEQVVADGLATVQANTEAVYQTLQEMGQEYSLSISEAITDPWKQGESAIQGYSEKFGLSMSATVEELKRMAEEFKKTMAEIEQAGSEAVNTVNQNVSGYQDAEHKKPETSGDNPDNKEIVLPKKGSKATIKKSATHWGSKSDGKKMSDWVPGKTFTVSNTHGKGEKAQILLSKKDKGKTVYMGWVNIKDLEGYARGTVGVSNNQLALIDELGEELVMHAGPNGRVQYLSRGTAVIPHNISENLMQLGSLDPSEILDNNRPVVGISPDVHNTEINLNISYGDILHIDEYTGGKPEDLTKIIAKEFDKHLKNVNQQLRRYTR